MKRKFAELLSRNVIAEITVMNCAQGCCFAAAILVFAFSMWNLAHLDLTAAEMILGVVWTTVSPLLLSIIGLMLPVFAKRADETN